MTSSRKAALGKQAAWCCVASLAIQAIGAPTYLAALLSTMSAGLGTAAVLRS